MASPRITRRRLLALGAAAPLALLARPAVHLARAAYRDGEGGSAPQSAAPSGFVDDASGLSATRVDVVPLDPARAEAQLAELFARARREARGVSIAGARHTMGGHTSVPGGFVVDMEACRGLLLDDARDVLTVGAGARWSEVLDYLNARGRSVAVMQSNSSFSVGGSLGANCHGWQHNRPPIASTVDAFRVVTADGVAMRASRTENAELFSLVLGGYGLFGVVLDVDLRVVRDATYRRAAVEVASEDYEAAFAEHVDRVPAVGMAYGRLSVCPKAFLTRAILTTYLHEDATAPTPAPLVTAPPSRLARAVFRGSVGSAYGKDLRWDLERLFGGEAGGRVSRNQILSEPVSLFQNRDPARTDILHEYFVPRAAFATFVAKLREIVPPHGQDLLNVTVRNVATDTDAFLRYADQPMFSLVMLWNHARTAEADAALARLTEELIDAALAVGGRHYLPYRLHGTKGQLARGYPQLGAFFDAKRRYDPGLLFQNHFFAKYGA